MLTTPPSPLPVGNGRLVGRFGVVDIYETSNSRELHEDNVHMNEFFYGTIARLIFGATEKEGGLNP